MCNNKLETCLFGFKIFSSLVVKCGCHRAYTNENSDNGNQKATLECGVSFNPKSPTNILLCNFFLGLYCYRSVEPIYKNKQLFRSALTREYAERTSQSKMHLDV